MLGLACSAAAGVLAGAIVALPYLVYGRLPELLGLPRAIRSVMPVVSANAHNLWWWASGTSARSYLLNSGQVPWTLDSAPLVGPLSYHLVALGLVGAFVGLAVLRVVRAPTFGAVFVAGAYTAFSFFMGMTQLHENHMYAVFPLLAVAMAVERRYWAFYMLLALTWCANMMLYDFDLTESVVVPLLPWSLEVQERLDVVINVVVLALWTAWMLADTTRAWLGRPAPQPPASVVANA
jgi:hypothetical protein